MGEKRIRDKSSEIPCGNRWWSCPNRMIRRSHVGQILDTWPADRKAMLSDDIFDAHVQNAFHVSSCLEISVRCHARALPDISKISLKHHWQRLIIDPVTWVTVGANRQSWEQGANFESIRKHEEDLQRAVSCCDSPSRIHLPPSLWKSCSRLFMSRLGLQSHLHQERLNRIKWV